MRRTLATFAVLALACGGGGKKEEHAEEEHGAHAEGVVELTTEQLKAAGIKIAKVERRAVTGVLEATAQIEAAGDRHAKIGARIEGRVHELKLGIGDAVKKGAALIVIESPELGQTKADYLAALAASRVTSEAAAREKSLFEKGISSEKDYREAEAAAVKARTEKEAAENKLHALGVTDAELPRKVEGHYTSMVTLRSPIDGVVVARTATLGQMVKPEDTLVEVMDLREVWAVIDVYEKDLSQVKEGQGVRVKVGAYPDREFGGTIDSVGAVVEEKSRAVQVRVVLPNPTGELKPGMFATVTVEGTTGERRERILVPAAAIQRDGDASFVFVPEGERDFKRRDVKVGRVAGELVEVEEGLVEGESVVTTGSFVLKSELNKAELGGGHGH